MCNAIAPTCGLIQSSLQLILRKNKPGQTSRLLVVPRGCSQPYVATDNAVPSQPSNPSDAQIPSSRCAASHILRQSCLARSSFFTLAGQRTGEVPRGVLPKLRRRALREASLLVATAETASAGATTYRAALICQRVALDPARIGARRAAPPPSQPTKTPNGHTGCVYEAGDEDSGQHQEGFVDAGP